MDALFNFISKVFTSLTNFVYVLENYLSGLVAKIDGITFDSSTPVYQMFGTLRYVSGDTVYTVITTLLTFLALFALLGIIRRFINFVLGFIPTVNIKLP